jgi:hypothetical protein
MASYDLPLKYIKSYQTRENLINALVKSGIVDHRHLVVKTEEDRWTAVFPQSNFEKYDIGYLGFYSQFGFYTFG